MNKIDFTYFKIFGLYWRITASVGFHYVPWTTEAFSVGGGFNFYHVY